MSFRAEVSDAITSARSDAITLAPEAARTYEALVNTVDPVLAFELGPGVLPLGSGGAFCGFSASLLLVGAEAPSPGSQGPSVALNSVKLTEAEAE